MNVLSYRKHMLYFLLILTVWELFPYIRQKERENTFSPLLITQFLLIRLRPLYFSFLQHTMHFFAGNIHAIMQMQDFFYKSNKRYVRITIIHNNNRNWILNSVPFMRTMFSKNQTFFIICVSTAVGRLKKCGLVCDTFSLTLWGKSFLRSLCSSCYCNVNISQVTECNTDLGLECLEYLKCSNHVKY